MTYVVGALGVLTVATIAWLVVIEPVFVAPFRKVRRDATGTAMPKPAEPPSASDV